MPRLDKNGRLLIPMEIATIFDLNLIKNSKIYFDSKELYISSKEEMDDYCFGKITLDEKNRFFFPKQLRYIFNNDEEIIFCVKQDRLYLKKPPTL